MRKVWLPFLRSPIRYFNTLKRLNSHSSIYPLLLHQMLQFLHCPCGPSLHLLQYVHGSHTLGSAGLNPALCWCRAAVERKAHLSWPAADALTNAAHDAFGLL